MNTRCAFQWEKATNSQGVVIKSLQDRVTMLAMAGTENYFY